MDPLTKSRYFYPTAKERNSLEQELSDSLKHESSLKSKIGWSIGIAVVTWILQIDAIKSDKPIIYIFCAGFLVYAVIKLQSVKPKTAEFRKKAFQDIADLELEKAQGFRRFMELNAGNIYLKKKSEEELEIGLVENHGGKSFFSTKYLMSPQQFSAIKEQAPEINLSLPWFENA